MGDTSIIIAFLIGLGMFLFIMSFAIMQYDRATMNGCLKISI